MKPQHARTWTKVADDRAFWDVLEAIPPATPVLEVAERFHALTAADRRALSRRLSEAVVAIDTPAHREAMRFAFETRLVGDPELVWTPSEPGARAVPLELQLTVVALGREAWAAVVHEPAVLRGAWPTRLGRKLAHALSLATDLSGLGLPA